LINSNVVPIVPEVSDQNISNDSNKPDSSPNPYGFLRSMIFSSLAVFAVSFVLFWTIRMELTELLKAPLVQAFPDKGADTIYLRVIDAFMAHLKLCFYFTLLVIIPFLTVRVWFKAMRTLEVGKFTVLITPLFLTFWFYLGFGFALFGAMPVIFQLLVSYSMDAGGVLVGDENAQALDYLQISVKEYVEFSMQLAVSFGLACEAPFLMAVLSRVGIFTAAQYRRNWGVAFIVLAMVASLLTPPDPWTMLMLLVPLYALYEFGIVLSWLVGKRVIDKDDDA